MKEFLIAIKNMGESGGNCSLEKIFEFFHKIGAMSRSDVIAAYQAFHVLKIHVLTEDERKSNESLLDKVYSALIGRMCAIICDTPEEERRNAALLFSKITKRDFEFRRFLQDDRTPFHQF